MAHFNQFWNWLNQKRLGPKEIKFPSAPEYKFILLNLNFNEGNDSSVQMAEEVDDQIEIIFKFVNECFEITAFRFSLEVLKNTPKFIAKKALCYKFDVVSIKSRNLYVYHNTKSFAAQKFNLVAQNEFLREACLGISKFKEDLFQVQSDYMSDPRAWVINNCPQKKNSLNSIWNLQMGSTFLSIDKEEYEFRTNTQVLNFIPFTVVLIPEPDKNFILRLLVPGEKGQMDYYSYKVNYSIDFSIILQEFLNMILNNKFITNEDHYFQEQQPEKDYFLLMNS